MKATIKFQLENGFGVAVIENAQKTELTFVSSEKYKKGEVVFASPYYRKGKLVCDVFRKGETYIATLQLPHYETYGHVVVKIGSHNVVNGYPVFEKTLTLEWKDCEILATRTEITPNKNYHAGFREFIATILHKPSGFQFDILVFDETRVNNNHSIRERSDIQYQLKNCKEIKRKYETEMVAHYEKLLEEFSSDKWANMELFYRGKMKVHGLDYSPNHNQDDVLKEHLRNEMIKEMIC